MYTVLRFLASSPTEIAMLEELGGALNELSPGCYEGLGRGGAAFAVSIAKDGSREEHMFAISEAIERYAFVVRRATARGIAVEIDTAIGGEEHGSALCFSVRFPAALIGSLAALGIAVELSVYA